MGSGRAMRLQTRIQVHACVWAEDRGPKSMVDVDRPNNKQIAPGLSVVHGMYDPHGADSSSQIELDSSPEFICTFSPTPPTRCHARRDPDVCMFQWKLYCAVGTRKILSLSKKLSCAATPPATVITKAHACSAHVHGASSRGLRSCCRVL